MPAARAACSTPTLVVGGEAMTGVPHVTGVQTTVTPFDSMVSAVALTEALIAGVLARLGETAHARMRRMDELRGGVVYGDGP